MQDRIALHAPGRIPVINSIEGDTVNALAIPTGGENLSTSSCFPNKGYGETIGRETRMRSVRDRAREFKYPVIF
jgi:hypothetical protein